MKSIRLSLFVPCLLAAGLAAVTAVRGADAPCCHAAPARIGESNTTLPDDSLYQLATTWQDQDGTSVTLADFAGQPVLVTMVFTHCAYACPRIVADLQAIRAALPAEVRDQVRIVLASFDTARDTPERLRTWAAEQQLDAGWTLLHGDATAVRELSVLLDISYVPQVDGSFGHGNRIVLLDARGVAVSAIDGLGAAPGPILAAATKLVRQPQ